MVYSTDKDRNMWRLVQYLGRFNVIPILENGKYLQQPIYVKDLAKATIIAFENPVAIKNEYTISGAYQY